MRIILVRHGQTPSNVAGLLDTAAPGPGLTELGRRQAAAIPDAFADREIETMAITSLVRTELTAAPLAAARGLTPMVLAGLREIEAGELEMRDDHAALREYIETVFAWSGGELNRSMPGGERGTEFFDRYDAAIAELAGTGADSAAVVSHGAAIRSWASARVRGLDRVQVQGTSMPNTAYVEFEGDPQRGWDLIEWSPMPAGGAHLATAGLLDPTAAAIAGQGAEATR